MRILVVEDDKKIASFVAKGLERRGLASIMRTTEPTGSSAPCTNPYDAAVIDVMLPRLDGLSIIEHLRSEKVLTPVLILSAKRSVDDRVKGLQTGGDDYLTKPFSFAELLARVQALIRRAGQEPEPTLLQAGDMRMDLLKREVTRRGKLLELQPREFALLHYLMRNPGTVVSKTMIIEHVWGYHFDPLTNIVDVLVSRLRNKVDREFDKKLIHTHRGVGYALKVS